jgi:hypothetical protein
MLGSIWKEGLVVKLLGLIKHRAVKNYGVVKVYGIALFFLELGTRWR